MAAKARSESRSPLECDSFLTPWFPVILLNLGAIATDITAKMLRCECGHCDCLIHLERTSPLMKLLRNRKETCSQILKHNGEARARQRVDHMIASWGAATSASHPTHYILCLCMLVMFVLGREAGAIAPELTQDRFAQALTISSSRPSGDPAQAADTKPGNSVLSQCALIRLMRW